MCRKPSPKTGIRRILLLLCGHDNLHFINWPNEGSSTAGTRTRGGPNWRKQTAKFPAETVPMGPPDARPLQRLVRRFHVCTHLERLTFYQDVVLLLPETRSAAQTPENHGKYQTTDPIKEDRQNCTNVNRTDDE